MVLCNPAFVGRINELKILDAALNSTFNGNGKAIFVCGEAGSGKSRLVKEFLKTTIKQKEINALFGWCLSDTRVPYFPFIEAFNDLFSDTEKLFSPINSQMCNQTDRSVPTQDRSLERSTQVWMETTFASIAKKLFEVSIKKPVVLVLEDIHWADSASLALLNYISRFINSERVLIIATFRSEGLNFDLEGQPSILVSTLRTMSREDLYEEIELSSLNQLEVGMIAESMLGGYLQDSFCEKLSVESQGNPLFVIEFLKLMISEGSIVQENDQWHPLIDKILVPSKIKDIILQRASALKLKQRRILDVASVIGEKFDYKLLASLLCQEQIQILEKLNLIASNTSLIKYENNSFLFDHAKAREVIYEELTAPLKTGYHNLVAERLEALLRKNERKNVAGDLAYHYEKAGNSQKTLVYSLLAGKEALAKFSNLEAKKWFSQVLSIAQQKAEYANERISAIEGIGDAYLAMGEFGEARNNYQMLLNNSEKGVVKLRAIRKAMASSRWAGDFSHSIEIAKEAEFLEDVNRLEYGRVLLIKGASLGSYGNTKDGLNYLEKALAVFEQENSLPDVAQGLNEIASLYQTQGYPIEAVASVKRAISLNENIGDLRGLVDAYFYAGQVFFNYRLPKEALACFNKAVEISNRSGYINRNAWASLYSAIVLDIEGDFEKAISQTLLAVKYAEKTDSHYAQSQAFANLLALYSKLGDIENAEKYYSKINLLFPDPSKAGSRLGYSSIIKAQALFFGAKKDWKKSNELFNLSIQLLEGALFPVMFGAMLKLDYAFVLEKQGLRVEADAQRKESLMLTQKIDNQFKNLSFKCFLTIKKESTIGEELEARLDIINTSRNAGLLLGVENLYPSSFEISKMPARFMIAKGSLNLKTTAIDPFQIETITFSLQATKEGVYKFTPKLMYEDNQGTSHFCQIDGFRVKVSSDRKSEKCLAENQTPALPVESIQNNPDLMTNFQFKNDVSKKVYDYLVCSFVEDYMRLRLSSEKSGWRTLMNAARQSKVPVSAVYGRKGRLGKVITELKRRGLVETRIFTGERGRGGNITRLRVCYEKEPVKRNIDFIVAKKDEK